MIRSRSMLLPVAAMYAAISMMSCTRPSGPTIGQVQWSLTRAGMAAQLIDLNVAQATDSGWAVPLADQAEDGALHVRFALADATPGTRYRYMIYHRNETYLLPGTPASGGHDQVASENFYGGFTDGFHLSPPADGKHMTIDDAIVIRSDPRNEFPHAPWARSPRMGGYSLLIVAMPESAFEKSPPDPAVVDLTKRAEAGFTEPYRYWINGPGNGLSGVSILRVPDVLQLHATLDLSKGVKGCSDEGTHLVSFIHHIDPGSAFDNVPVVSDMSTGEYTPAEFDSMLCFTPREKLIRTLPNVATDPCASMRYDTIAGCLEIRNPAASPDRLRKENVAVRSRLAFTYGRFRVHCQLAPLLNDSDLWNGLTNAVWLVGAGAEDVLRRPCEGGYISYGGDGGTPGRRATSTYAEIDFEIMKGMPLCPERSYPPIYPQQVADANNRTTWLRELPLEVVRQRGKVAVACTNWDLACPDPPSFGIGCNDLVLDGQVFTGHRWDSDYRAITQKSMEADDKLFGEDGYWYEIDWRPEEIFWRIGPTLEKMRTVGYMNSTMTSVPDIPMWLVISQEFHSTAWWPGAPYDQAGVPFPAKDLIGRIYEIRVE